LTKPKAVAIRDFCSTQKESGTYMNGDEEVRCHRQGDNMYTFVAKQAATGVLQNRQEKLVLNQPGWATDGSTCNTWLFVNDGAQAIDYARNNPAWTS
jgi:hypothetical protein